MRSPMSTSFIRFLNELERYKSFLLLKIEKIEDSPLKNQADGQPIYERPLGISFKIKMTSDLCLFF